MKNLSKKIRSFASRPLILLPILIIIGGIIGFMGVQAFSSPSKSVSNTKCDGICVSLNEDGIDPSELAVKVGEFVQFNSADGKRHNISEGDGADTDHSGLKDIDQHDHVGGYVSGNFEADEAWRVQFKKPGTYKLHDHYNPNQRILVIVYEANPKPN